MKVLVREGSIVTIIYTSSHDHFLLPHLHSSFFPPPTQFPPTSLSSFPLLFWSSVFIYSCPGYKCSVKERMIYSSCKNPLVSALSDEGIEIKKSVSLACKSSTCNSPPPPPSVMLSLSPSLFLLD